MTEQDRVCADNKAEDGESGRDESFESEGLASEAGEEVMCHEAGGRAESCVEEGAFHCCILRARRWIEVHSNVSVTDWWDLERDGKKCAKD